MRRTGVLGCACMVPLSLPGITRAEAPAEVVSSVAGATVSNLPSGVTVAVEPVVTSLDNGATLTTFVLPSGEVVEVTTPPAQFTPLSATQSQLIEFGFPPRPLDAADLEAWTAAMAAYDSSPAPDGPMEVVTGPATMADFTVYGGWGGWVAPVPTSYNKGSNAAMRTLAPGVPSGPSRSLPTRARPTPSAAKPPGRWPRAT